MKNSKGFTLIELMAVIVILGLIMMIAVPNTITLMDKNKKSNYIENAKTFASLVQAKLQTDRKIEEPTVGTAFVMTLDDLNTNDIVDSPYGLPYDKGKSFVAVTLEDNKYVYYVHLVSCVKKDSCNEWNREDWRGIELVNVDELSGDNRFELVKNKGANARLLDDVRENPNSSEILKNKELYPSH